MWLDEEAAIVHMDMIELINSSSDYISVGELVVVKYQYLVAFWN